MRHTEEWWATAPAHIIRCNGTVQDGTPCRREALAGTTVCRQHGGLIPVVQAKAATRIRLSADEAVRVLLDILNDPNGDDRNKIVVAKDILDRGGLAATSKHLVGVVTQDPVEKLFASILSDPNALEDPSAPRPPALPAGDPAQEAIDAAEAAPEWGELFGPENGFSSREDVVDAEVVEAEVVSDVPPAHIRRDLERLL